MSGHLAGPALIVDGEDLRALAELVTDAARRRQMQGPALSRAHWHAAELVLTAAKAWTVPVTSGSDRGSDPRSEIDSGVSDLGRFEWLSTREAAAKANTSTRAIVAAIARGALEARRRGRGRGVWEVTSGSVEAYVSRHNRSLT